MLRPALVSLAGAVVIVVAWSLETEADGIVVAAMIGLYLAPLAVGATGWRAALLLAPWVLAGAIVANYGPAPLAWDAKAGFGVPLFAGAAACCAAAARSAVFGVVRWRRRAPDPPTPRGRAAAPGA